MGALKNTGYASGSGLISIASPPFEAPASTTTDKEGRFQLKGLGRDRAWVLEIHGPNISRRRIWVATLATPPKALETSVGLYGPSFEHVAGPARPVGGKITDEQTGEPVPGVRIIGSVPPMGYASGLQIEAITDQQGNYLLEGLPKDTREYSITADTLQGMTYLPQEQTHPDPAGLKLLTVNFALEHGTLGRRTIKGSTDGSAGFRNGPLLSTSREQVLQRHRSRQVCDVNPNHISTRWRRWLIQASWSFRAPALSAATAKRALRSLFGLSSGRKDWCRRDNPSRKRRVHECRADARRSEPHHTAG